MKLPGFIRRYQVKDYNFILVVLVIILSVIGVMVVGSAKEMYQSRQILGVVIGIFAMVIVSLIDFTWILDFYRLIYGITLAILVAVLLFGNTVNGAKRWIDLGFTSFQPSELAKILLILFFARYLEIHKSEINEFIFLVKFAILCALPLGLVFMEPNLSTTLCTAAVLCLLIYLAGLNYSIVGKMIVVIVPVIIVLLIIAIQPNQPFLQEYQQDRILAFLNPDEYSSSEGYQQDNSVMAIGSGQLTGKGLNNNDTDSVKNGNFISEPQTDFIFAIVGEELGFVGSCIIVALLLLIVLQCLLIGLRSPYLPGKIISCGVGGLIGIQSFINISVATKLLPNTGVPLPFVSYGLTSLVSLFIGIGLVLNVGLQSKRFQ